MSIDRASSRLAAWLAAAALLLASLAPAVSHALARGAVEGLAVCSATAAPGTPAGDTDGGTTLQHCPLCLSHAFDDAVPPPSAPRVPALPVVQAVPAIAAAHEGGHAVWQRPQPRGPPATLPAVA